MTAETKTDHGPEPERAANWASIPGLAHGFTGRERGCSPAPWNSLNLSNKVGDDPANVERNWRDTARALSLSSIVKADQVHGTEILVVDGADTTTTVSTVGEADGLITTTAGVGIAIMTADCVPILMVAPEYNAVMALHAGWRGTVAGIAATGLAQARRDLGIPAEAWLVALGPAIDQCCYVVSSEIGCDLVNRWGAMPDAWHPDGDHGQLFLRRANAAILVQGGVRPEAIQMVGSCTACTANRYFSHRASEGRAGRQASIIGFCHGV